MNRHVGLLLGAIASSCAALTLVGCGDDSGAPVGQDGAADQTSSDATNDVTISDATNRDAGNADADGSTGDSTTLDAGSDRTTAEGGGEGGPICPVFDASTLDDASVLAGFQQVWLTYRCYTCHQKPTQPVDDAGNGILLSGNNTGLGDSGTIFPPNLTSDPGTGLGCWTDPQIVDAILNGNRLDGGALCRPMPKFGTAQTNPDGGPKLGYPMNAGTAQQIVQFLRSLPVVVDQVPATMCPSGAPEGGTDAGSDAAGDDGGDAAVDAIGQ